MHPERVGPYRILERLGRGGMGIVYRAAHVRTGALAALKTVLLPSGKHLAAIRREVQALARIDHPGVVRIISEGIGTDGLPWYAMQLLHGMSLREHRFELSPARGMAAQDGYWAMNIASRAVRPTADAGRPVATPQRPTPQGAPLDRRSIAGMLGIFRKLCAPLAYVHGEGLVHCDLKPENIFLQSEGDPVLVDFGLISRFGSGLYRESLDVELFMGTAEYMAPEQWEGKPVDARTDLYALGCILFEAIAGRPPFAGDRNQMYRAHLLEEAPRLSSLAPEAPAELDELVAGLLHKRPRDRIGHADDVARRLAMLGAAGPREVGPTPRPYLFRPSFSGRGHATNEVVGLISAEGERGRLVIIEGESGVGKTRLAMEAARMAKRGGIRVLTGECAAQLDTPDHDDTVHAAPLLPFKAPLLYVADRVREEGKLAFTALLGDRARVLARIEPEIGLLDQTAQLPRLVPLSAEAERARILAAVTETLAALGAEKRTFLVLDDIQWADELTQDLLHFLMAQTEAWPNVVILATCRGESIPPAVRSLMKIEDVGHLRLARLGPRAVESVVTDMLGVPPPGHFAEFLTRQTAGNPFFVAEYLRAAMTHGLLARDAGGKWSVTVAGGHYDELGLPSSLVDLLAMRLDTLGGESRSLLEAFAVLGREAPADLAQAVAGLTDRAARLGVEELFRKQVLEESGRGALRFAHDKLREVTYERLAADRRTNLHRSAAETIERRIAEPAPATLARHWERAKNEGRAIHFLELAAEKAMATGAHREATAALHRVLELAGPAGATNVERRRAANWHRRLGEAHLAGGQLAKASEHSSRSLALLEHPPPTTTGGWGARLFGQLMLQVVHRALPPRTYEEPERRDVLSEATQATGTIARIAFFENDPVRIVGCSLWSINLAERAGHLVEAARNYSGLGWVFGLSGLHAVADNYFARARRTGLETNDWNGLIFSLTSEAVYRIGRAQWELANDALTACEEPCRITGDQQALELVETLRGHPEYFAGRFDAAISRHRYVLDSARSRQNAQHEAWSLYCGARSALALDRADEAIVDLEAAARLLEDQTDEMSQITCFGLLASARCRLGDLEGADEAANRTLEAIGSKAPTVFLTLHGYEGVVEVGIAKLAAANTKSERKQIAGSVRRSLRKMKRAAKTFVVGAPRVALLEARFHAALADVDSAKKSLNRGIDDARNLSMPHDVYELQKALAQLAQ